MCNWKRKLKWFISKDSGTETDGLQESPICWSKHIEVIINTLRGHNIYPDTFCANRQLFNNHLASVCETHTSVCETYKAMLLYQEMFSPCNYRSTSAAAWPRAQWVFTPESLLHPHAPATERCLPHAPAQTWLHSQDSLQTDQRQVSVHRCNVRWVSTGVMLGECPQV